MNDVLNIIKERRSVKKYSDKVVSKDIIEKIVEAGTYAPTGRGLQSPIILAITNKEIRDELSKTNCEVGGWDLKFDPFYNAPAVLVVLADKATGTHLYDGSLVMENMMIAAASLGVDSCWIHRARETFELPKWKSYLKSLGIEGDYEGIGNLIIGYRDGQLAAQKPRKANYVYFVE